MIPRTRKGVDIARFCVESGRRGQVKLGTLEKLLDPFTGGGSIPLEAQRLGLEAHASDLNPVAVLINKALIEIPPKFAGHPPVNPEASKSLLQREWRGAQGLAEDVRHYGKWMRAEAEKHIGYLYPKIRLPKELGGNEATVIAWLWVRTITCPNPACGAQMPLTSKWWLSKKKGKDAWVEPVIDHNMQTILFEVHTGKPSTSLVKAIESGTCATNDQGKKTKATFRCIVCNIGIARGDYIDSEANKGQMDTMPIAIVAEGKQGRVYLPIDNVQMQTVLELTHEYLAKSSIREKVPTEPARGTFASNAQGRIYGFKTFRDYFTSRQLVALIVFSNLVQEAREKVMADASFASLPADEVSLNGGRIGADAYADAVATYLGLGVSKMADYNSSLVSWSQTRDQATHTFTRQALPMVWDFVEVNPFAGAAGDLTVTLSGISEILEHSLPVIVTSRAQQLDATARIEGMTCPLISTDPPYYDNVSYADLSDYFYIWLRRSLGNIYGSLFSTLLVPKAQELIATPYRFGGDRKKAKDFFEDGLGKAFARMLEIQGHDYPMTVYYAFKQAESEENSSGYEDGPTMSASTGWETMLEGLLKSGFSITGTWPMRSERGARVNSLESNSLASSIVLVCRSRPADAQLSTRRDFLNALKRELPKALKDLQRGNIAPVDLAQAAIGPGMAVFSRYSKVLESDGTAMRVRTALQLINQTLDEVLAEQEGEYDADTRWAVAWFEQYGMDEGPYGVAETLSKAKNTAVGALVEASILWAQGGKVRLLRREEFSSNWHPATAKRITAWEVTQRLIRALQEHGDAGAADILDHVGAYGEVARDLAYRLYMICERKKWADEALAYNSLVVEWSDISGAAEQLGRTTAEQASLFS